MQLTFPAHPAQQPATAPQRIQADALMLDLDGTLIDTLGDFHAALSLALAELALPPIAPKAIARMVGKGTEHLLHSVLAHILPRPPAPDEQQNVDLQKEIERHLPELHRAYQAHYLRINGQHSAPYPGVVDGLHALARAGLPLACVTNKPLAFARPLLQSKGLDGLFAHIFGGDSFARKKPDPLPLLQTCAALGTAPARTLMIGDSANDAQSARAAGCPVLLMTYGYNHGEPIITVDADGYLDNLTQLQIQPSS